MPHSVGACCAQPVPCTCDVASALRPRTCADWAECVHLLVGKFRGSFLGGQQEPGYQGQWVARTFLVCPNRTRWATGGRGGG